LLIPGYEAGASDFQIVSSWPCANGNGCDVVVEEEGEAERIFFGEEEIFIFLPTPLDFHSLFDFIRIWAGLMGSRSGSDP
jgi:hypothetical protein